MSSINKTTGKAKTIGLLTCFLDNCGACLQAYALQNIIQSLGYNVQIIKYTEPWGYYDANLKNSSKVVDLLRCIKNPDFRKSYYTGQYRVTAFNKFRKKYLNFSPREYKMYSQLQNSTHECDAYVCGSDQIWNPTFYNKCNPAYYLAFVEDSIPKIAYAPSIGINDIPTQYLDDFKQYISRFDSLSSREQTGVEIIEKYTHRKATLVLDPTLLLPGKSWRRLIPKRRPITKKRYLLCYLFAQHEYYDLVIERLSKQLQCEVVIIPVIDREYIVKHHTPLGVGPIEFINLIESADFILTDSFHGTVFSLLFNKSFYCLKRDNDVDCYSMNSRLYNILNLVNMKDRLLTQEEALDTDYSRISDDAYCAISDRIEVLRENSITYLKNALGDHK